MTDIAAPSTRWLRSPGHQQHPGDEDQTYSGGSAILIVNPTSDPVFVRRVHELHRVFRTPAELQARLRDEHPAAVVRPRGLSGEAEAWYVYRDGRWVPSTPRQD